MQVHNGHKQGEEYEGVDQVSPNHDLRPVITSHEAAYGHQAEHEEQPRRVVSRPLPENSRTHGEDQEYLHQPETRPHIRTHRRITHRGCRQVELCRRLIFALPPNGDSAANLLLQASHGLDVVSIDPIAKWNPIDRDQPVSHLGTFILSLGIPPDEVVWYNLLNLV